MSRDTADFARATRFLEDLQREISDRTTAWPWGVAYLHSRYKRVWDLNLLYLNDPPPGVTAAAIVEHAEEIMGAAGVTHRRVWIPDERLGRQLAPGFEELGWTTDVHVVMAHRRPLDPLVDTSGVEEIGERAWAGRERQLRSYPWCDDDALVAEMRGLYRLFIHHGGGRDFGIMEDGLAISFALLFSRGGIAQIEDVATLEEHRGRGLSRGVMQVALQEAQLGGHRLTFLIADDRDWPKDFYARLGFDPVGRYFYFLKTEGGIET